MLPTRIFIVTPIVKAYIEDARKKHEAAVECLKAKGHEIVNEVFNKKNRLENSLAYQMSEDLTDITMEADCAYFLDGWMDTRRCRLIHDFCKCCDIPCIYETKKESV